MYDKFSLVASSDNRSLAQETIVLLRKAFGLEEERIARRKKLLNETGSREIPKVNNLPDPAEVIREDREG